MSTIKETILSSFLCILLNINQAKCIKFDDLNNWKRQNDVERCNTNLFTQGLNIHAQKTQLTFKWRDCLRYGAFGVSIDDTCILRQ